MGLAVAWAGWPRLGSLLFAYALAARVPVVLVMGLAIRWSWGTHYDALAARLSAHDSPRSRWWWTGVVPQMTIWVAATVIVGALSGALAWHLASPPPRPERGAGTPLPVPAIMGVPDMVLTPVGCTHDVPRAARRTRALAVLSVVPQLSLARTPACTPPSRPIASDCPS